MSADLSERIARALHAEDVKALSPRVTVEDPPLADDWNELHTDDRALYLRAAGVALSVVGDDESRRMIERALLDRYGPGSHAHLTRELAPLNAHGMAVCALVALGARS